MNLRLLTSLALISLAPMRAYAGIDLTWNDCVRESSIQDLNFTNCGTEMKTIRLFGSFKVDQTLPRFIAADLTFDLVDQSTSTLPPFWRFDDTANGGCNSVGLVVRNDAQLDGYCSSEVSPWGVAGNAQILTHYISSYNGYACRGRLMVSIVRNPNDPFPLEAGTNYYMCHLALNTSQRASCSGCGDKVAIAWSVATLYENDNNALLLSGPDKLGSVAGVNHAFTGIADPLRGDPNFPCAPVPVRRSTWGTLKTLYR